MPKCTKAKHIDVSFQALPSLHETQLLKDSTHNRLSYDCLATPSRLLKDRIPQSAQKAPANDAATRGIACWMSVLFTCLCCFVPQELLMLNDAGFCEAPGFKSS
jgi:hypothetical protein